MAHRRKPLAVALGLNTVVLVAEVAGGVQASRLSLIIDGVHNLSDGRLLWSWLPPTVIQRAGGEFFSTARKPRRSTAWIIWGTVTSAGSNLATASFAARLTSARLTPFSPSRAFFTPTGQAPQVIPSTVRTTVEVAATAGYATTNRPSIAARTEPRRVIASLPCCGRPGTDPRS